MNLVPANIGAEPKKIAMLGGLLLVAGVVYFMNRDSSPTSASVSPKTSPLSVGTIPAAKSSAAARSSRIGIRPTDDFKPSLKLKEGVDISKIDPTLKLDLLARVNGVAFDMGTRGSVFDWG